MLAPNPTIFAHPKRLSFQAIQAKKTTTARTTIAIARRALLLDMGRYRRQITPCNARRGRPHWLTP